VSKNRHFGEQFCLDFAAEIYFNVAVLPYKLPIIDTVAPEKLYSEYTIRCRKKFYVFFLGGIPYA